MDKPNPSSHDVERAVIGHPRKAASLPVHETPQAHHCQGEELVIARESQRAFEHIQAVEGGAVRVRWLGEGGVIAPSSVISLWYKSSVCCNY